MDVDKIVERKVFVGEDLLMMMEKRYDPMLRLVKNFSGDGLFEVTPRVIKEVFMLNPNTILLEEIDLGKL